ncbi:M28 family peptidase [Gibbsiella quercinecans]|uniref:M28 family peptidase n=1 Tax=Gibbsiella quercinecans TaxID=929813 RepID=UPI003A4E2AB5
MPLSELNQAQLAPLMQQLLARFQHLHRLSGSADAEHSADVLLQMLEALGIVATRERCPLLLSDPLSASLVLPGNPDWRCEAKTRSFSAHCPQGVEAELFYDERSRVAIPDRLQAQWAEQVRGKIVIADQGFEDYVQRLAAAGAAGLVHIWGSPEEALHEETVGPIWGTPVPDDAVRYPALPVVSINQQQGQSLLALCRQGRLTARLATEVRVHVAECSLPLVTIAGRSDEFVLLSSHYDSWHEGVTDNATGNALCLALALHFHQQRGQLQRGLRIAWWPGHSNARYGGSTWYADRHRAMLQKHCVAHINVDSPGCRQATEVVINASGAEDLAFLNQAVIAVTDAPARRIAPLGKGGDQSFWGSGIALHFAFREEPAVRATQSPGSGGGWWWHTQADTLDKVDEAILWRDCRIHAHWLAGLLSEPALPADLESYRQQMVQSLVELQVELDARFDLTPLLLRLAAMAADVSRTVAGWRQDPWRWQPTVRGVLALWHQLRYSSTDDFHYDLSYRGGAFPGLQLLRGQHQADCTAVTFLMMETQFYRQRDRALSLLAQSHALLCEQPKV